MVDEVIVKPLGFFEGADLGEAETSHEAGGAVVLGGDGDDDAVDAELGERVGDHGLADGAHDAAALGGGHEPVGGEGDAGGPVNAVVPDHADEFACSPDAAGEGAGFFAVAQGLGDEFLRVRGLRGSIDPRQPSAKSFPIGVHEREERGRIAGLKEAQFETGVDLVAQHCGTTLGTGGAETNEKFSPDARCGFLFGTDR